MKTRIQKILNACDKQGISLTALVLKSGLNRGNVTRINNFDPTISEKMFKALEETLTKMQSPEMREEFSS